MLVAIVIWIEVVAMSKQLRHMLTVVVMVVAVVSSFAIAPAAARATDTGSITTPMPTKRSQLT